MQIIDNVNTTVKEDLREELHKGSKLSIAAACFSIYAYQELKTKLEEIDELRFIFTSPTFVTEKVPKTQREFYEEIAKDSRTAIFCTSKSHLLWDFHKNFSGSPGL